MKTANYPVDLVNICIVVFLILLSCQLTWEVSPFISASHIHPPTSSPRTLAAESKYDSSQTSKVLLAIFSNILLCSLGNFQTDRSTMRLS